MGGGGCKSSLYKTFHEEEKREEATLSVYRYTFCNIPLLCVLLLLFLVFCVEFTPTRSLVAHTYLQDAAGSGLSPLVDLVVAQGAVGTVLSTEGEDDAVFGFATALPLRYLARDNQCAQASASCDFAC